MRYFSKKTFKIISIVLGIIFLYYLSFTVKLLWDNYQEQRKIKEKIEMFEEAMRKPYKEDVYGGKTPEETWAMFLDALKKGDIDLASKYYDVEHQGEAKERLESLKREEKLGQIIKEMEGLRKVEWDENNKWLDLVKDRAHYFYNYKNEEGEEFSDFVNFYLNPYTKVWKILY